MNQSYRIEEEYPGGSSSSSTCISYRHPQLASTSTPQPMEGLHESRTPPFLTKTYDIVEDSNTNHIISWSKGDNSFIVWDPQTFSISLLPRYFKHDNFSSFVRQLNTYGFRKVDPDRWEFANEGFLRGQRRLLKTISRRKTTTNPHTSQQSPDACVEVGRFGLDGEIDRLRRDKHVLMMELVKLRQQQQTTKACLQLMEKKLRRTETKQQQMMSFLARAMQNPNFVQQLIRQKDMRKELQEAIGEKRRRPIDQGGRATVVNVVEDDEELGQGFRKETFVKIEPESYDDITEFEVSEPDKLAMDMQGLSERNSLNEDQHMERRKEHGNQEKEIDDVFWEDLLSDDFN